MRKILLTFRSLAIAAAAIVFPWNIVSGQVATLQNWTNVYHGRASDPQNISYPVQEGSNTNRMLVVAISTSRTSIGVMSVTLSYGSQALTLANGDMNIPARQHTALYYLNEAGLDAAGTEATLTVGVSGGTICNTDVWTALFDYVDQGNPLHDSKTVSSGSLAVTSLSLSTPLSIKAFEQAVEVVLGYNSSKNQPSAITYATDWNMVLEQITFYNSGASSISINNGVANRNLPSTYITDASLTSFDNAAQASITALSLNFEPPPPPTIQASDIIFSDVTGSSFTISWTPGDGTNRLVLLKEGSAVDDDPADGTSYTASNIFGNGSQTGTGNYVVYNGTGSSVTVMNLEANTVYHAAVYEFSVPPGMEDYLTPPATGSQLTKPETAVNGDYRSKASGNWGTPETWQTYSSGSWVDALESPSSSAGIITIRNGHSIDVTDAITIDQVMVESNAQVTVKPGVTLTVAEGADDVDCNINGILFNSGTIVTTGTLAFGSGSTYQHALNGGIIPNATWDANSTCLITGISDSAPSGFGQSFGDFTWNCPAQTIVVAMNSDITVKGNFRITSTGTGRLSVINSGTPGTLTVSGDYIQTGGTFDFNSGAGSTTAAYLNVSGNFSFTGGSITETSSGSGNINFNGVGQRQMYTSGGTLSNTINFVVEEGAYLQMGTGPSPSTIRDSNGTFTLSAGATLGITDRSGITTLTSGSLGGNIKVSGTRIFDTGANYIYNGDRNQFTGDGLPLTVNSLVIDNTGGIVSFNAARTIASFSITNGSIANLGNSFVHTSGMLTLGGTGQPAGSYGHTISPAEFKNDIFFASSTGIVNNTVPAGTWLGSVSTDWNEGLNWSDGNVPTSETDAFISSYPVNQPVISGTVTAECGTLTIGSGASLTIDNSGKATISSIENNGTMSLNSDAEGIASLILDSYSGSGQTRIQLYLTGGGDETNYPWHYISSPVTELSTDAVMTGGDGPDASDLAAYHEEIVVEDKDLAWMGYDGWDYQNEVYTENGFDELETGLGYNYYSYYDATRDIEGIPNTTGVDKSLSYSGTTDGLYMFGWNLLGNPFTSSISWDVINDGLPEGGEIDDAIYFTRNNTVVSYVDGIASTEGVSGDIPPMQGFFVKANAVGQSIDLFASARVHSTQSRYKGEGETVPLVRLKLENKALLSDETVIRLNEKAENTFDSKLDAYKTGTAKSKISLWTVTGKVPYSINSIPFPEAETEVSIGMNLPGSDSYKLTATRLQGMDNYNVYLTDKTTGAAVNLKNTSSMSFRASNGTFKDRFVIRITASALRGPVVTESEFNIYASGDMVNIQTLSDEWEGKKGSIRLIDISGIEISRLDNNEFCKDSFIQIPAAKYKGLYFVRIESGLMKYVGKVMIK